MAEINIVGIGIALILVGFFVVIIGSLTGKDVKVGVGGFIGPFAFGWANDPQMLKWVMAITVIIALIFLLMNLKGIRIF